MSCLNGLLVVNIELTSRCNKSCWMCGRRKIDKDYPEIKMQYGDMEFGILEMIEPMVPKDIVVQFHNNGEPLLYPRLGEALAMFRGRIRCLNTNAKLLTERPDEVIDNMESLTVSVVENDPETDDQYDIVKKFLKIKGDRKPQMVYRLLGDVGKFDPVDFEDLDEIDYEREYFNRINRWHKLPGTVATRTLHSPMGSFSYDKKVTVPEHGICLDLLSHLVIDRWGNVYPCVRFNPQRHNLLGNVGFLTLDQMWNGDIRKKIVSEHVAGNRNCSELCKKCEFYGCPVS